MIIQDIKGWTYGFMKRNEHQCVKYIISLEEDATNAIQHENFSRASVLFRDIVGGFEKLSVIDKDNYELPLYTALFCLAKIAWWGMQPNSKIPFSLTRRKHLTSTM